MKTIIKSLLLCLILLMPGCKQGAGNNAKYHIGLQLYGLRDVLARDFTGTLSKVADMGYEGVELTDLFGHSPARVKQICDSLNLTIFSAHIPVNDLLRNAEAEMKTYKEIGCKYVVVPWVDGNRRPGGRYFDQFPGEIKQFKAAADRLGLTLVYHNHDFEFTNVNYGGTEQYAFDYIFSQVPGLDSELDVCWAHYAGADPLAYMDKLAGHLPIVHIKDYARNARGGIEFRPLGKGVMDVPALVNKSIEIGANWLVVEQDNPSMGMNSIESAAASLEYLKTLLPK